MARPLLLVSIDVEEDMPDWRITDPLRVTNVRQLPRLAEACGALGVRPTYLCDYPVATEPASAGILRELAAREDSEIGTHLHAWNTPPFPGVPGREGDERRHTYYQFELSPEGLAAKLDSLHQAVTDVAGTPPVSFRAGRYGIDGASLLALIERGYTVDTSVTPLADHSGDGGPDFRNATRFPYLPDATDPRRPGRLPIVEIPVSIALTRRLPLALQRAYVHLPKFTRLRGILSRDVLGLVDYAWLYPFRFDLELMKRVADVLVAQESPVLNVFLHSSELAPGTAGRKNEAADVERSFSDLLGILTYCIEAHDAEPLTLREAGERLAPSLGLQREAQVG